MTEIKYELINEIGITSTRCSGWRKEIDCISYETVEGKREFRKIQKVEK